MQSTYLCKWDKKKVSEIPPVHYFEKKKIFWSLIKCLWVINIILRPSADEQFKTYVATTLSLSLWRNDCVDGRRLAAPNSSCCPPWLKSANSQCNSQVIISLGPCQIIKYKEHESPTYWRIYCIFSIFFRVTSTHSDYMITAHSYVCSRIAVSLPQCIVFCLYVFCCVTHWEIGLLAYISLLYDLYMWECIWAREWQFDLLYFSNK